MTSNIDMSVEQTALRTHGILGEQDHTAIHYIHFNMNYYRRKRSKLLN